MKKIIIHKDSLTTLNLSILSWVFISNDFLTGFFQKRLKMAQRH